MDRAVWPTVLRVLCLVALAASAALTIDYLSPNPAFCGAASGCGAVRRSGWGYLGPVPLPAFGLVGFAAVLGLSLGPASFRRYAALSAILGAVVAAALLAIQAVVLGVFCWLCVIVDAAAIGAGAAAARLLIASAAADETSAFSTAPLTAGAWAGLGVIAVVAPLLWPSVRPAGEVPAGVRERFVPGKINVVEFVDFQCPFCRMFHPVLKSVVREYGERVNFVRLDLPLDSHEHARGAAKAHLCAVEQGKGDAMADALFEAEDLADGGLVAAAKEVGLDVARFETCRDAPETEAKLQSVERILRDSDMLQGLPTTFVGNTMIVGARDEVALRDAFEKAAHGESDGGVPAPAYVSLLVLGAGLVVWLGQARGSKST